MSAVGEPANDLRAAQRRANRALLAKLGVVVVGMFAFGYALVPFYRTIGEVTGLRDVDQPDAVASTRVDASRVVRVEFASNMRDMPWRFQPLEPVMSVHPGAVTRAEFEVVNMTDRAVTGQAVPGYGPRYAAQYLRKLECFCFSQQTLRPGESRRVPVVFVIDPSAPAQLRTIRLSYTFFEVEGRGKPGTVAAAPLSRGG